MMKAMTRWILFLVFFLFLGISSEAQINNSVYFMPGVPQSNRVNPANQPNCGFYFGIPVLSPVVMEISSNSLAYKDIIYPHPYQDSLITFLHPEGDKQAFLNKLKPMNYLTADIRASLLSLGFRTEVGFFTFDMTTRTEEAIYFPADLARLLMYGVAEGETYQLDGMGVDVTAFDEVAVGWSHGILDNLQIGARAKMLFGVGDITTQRSDLSLSTSEDMWNIKSDIMVSASLPFADVIYDEDGNIEDVIIKDDISNLEPFSLPRYIFNTKNPGFAVDLGVNYRPIDQLLISASAVDIGFISWKDEVHDATYAMEYEYDGIELNPFEFDENNSLEDYLDSTFAQMGDSLGSFLQFTQGRTYSKRLNTKLYIGASYSLNPHISFGLLSRTDFLRERIAQQVTATASFSAGRIFNFTLSYTYKDSYLKNIGAGFSVKAGPVNLYVVSDNALNAVFWPQETHSANFWMGMNFIFGCKEQIDIDRPLIY